MRKILNHELNRLSHEEIKQATKFPVHIVLDNLRSAHNIGSFFRTADSFGMAHIHLCGICATPPNTEIEKTALGATQTVSYTYHDSIVDCLTSLANQHFPIYGVEQLDGAISLELVNFPHASSFAIVFGSEVGGISDSALPFLNHGIEIPQFGTKHSLNVSVCGGIILWKALEQLKFNKP